MNTKKEPVIVYEDKPDIAYIDDNLQLPINITIGLSDGEDFYLKISFKNLTTPQYVRLLEIANRPKEIKFTSDLILKENYNITHIVITHYISTSNLEMNWECLSDDPNFSLIIE